MKLSYFSTLGRIGAFFLLFLALTESSCVLLCVLDFQGGEVPSFSVCDSDMFCYVVGFRKSWVDCSVGKVLLSCLMTTDEELNMRGRWRQFFASAGWEKYVLNRSYKLEVDAT